MDQCWATSHAWTERKGFNLLTSFLLGFMLIVGASSLDELAGFCGRVYHQSVVVNNTLYIDGGIETLTNASANGQKNIITTPGNLFSIDLKSSWEIDNVNMNLLGHASLPRSTLAAPKLVRGALYPGPRNDTTKIYSFGGTAITSGYGEDGWLWTYDTQNNQWGTFNPDIKSGGTTASRSLVNPVSGASVGVPELGLGFWFNGEQDNGTSFATQGIGGVHRFLGGMMVFDFNSGTAKNISTSAVSTSARARGKMVYVPGVGKKGALVLIGGVEKVASVDTDDWRGALVPMDQILIFDIASLDNSENGIWYRQKAVGIVPEPRIDHCLVVASAQDGSSHNIYMYAGTDGTHTYDDVYILTLPSFQWVMAFKGARPRYGMTCDLAGQRQMVIVGGAVSLNISETCDPQRYGLAVIDLTTIAWLGSFVASSVPYEVPMHVLRVVGGSSVGGATVVQPTNGFSSPGLSSLFLGLNQSATSGMVDTSTPRPNAGAIAGGVVGGVVIVGLISLALFMLHKRRTVAGPAEEEKLGSCVPGEVDGTGVNRSLGEMDGNAHQRAMEMPAYEPPELLADP